MKTRHVDAAESKTKCFALLDEIQESGGPITITRRGLPVAVVGAVKRRGGKSPKNIWDSKARIVGDIVNPDVVWVGDALSPK